MLNSESQDLDPPPLPSAAQRPQLKAALAQQRARLEHLTTLSGAPILLRRTLQCLEEIESALEPAEGGDGRRLSQALEALQQVESHAEADLAFLNRDARE